MGAFYTSHTLRGPAQEQVLAWLDGRSAFVSISEQSFTVVLDEASETGDGTALEELGTQLSADFACPVLAVLNYDDDVLYVALFQNGQLVDDYDSNPGYFEEVEADGDGEPTGMNSALLAAAFGASDDEAVEAVLRRSGDDGYVFETERHRDLAAALGLPEFSVGVGYLYVSADDVPDWVPEGTYVPSGAAVE